MGAWQHAPPFPAPTPAAVRPCPALRDAQAGPAGNWFLAFSDPQPNQPSPGSVTMYQNLDGSWSGCLYRPPET